MYFWLSSNKCFYSISFGSVRLKKVNKHPDTKAIIDYIEKGDLQAVSDNMVNVLETVTCEKYPVIEQI